MTDLRLEAGKLGALARVPKLQRSASRRVALLHALLDAVPLGAPRFLIAGGFASLVNWLVRFPLSVALPFEPAVALAYAIGMAVGFGLYRSWVFPGSALPLGVQLSRFVAVNAAGVATVMIGARLFLAAIAATGLLAHGPAQALAHALAIVLGAVVNFLGHRALTFARSRSGRPAAL